eukprot:TRINITY_DN11874_c0_g1_i1.p2 TRINITY_DN11874_c0_g1~~TRINITY_DN11874_c0_g1_i1.p2  ORF type:complete len:159 (+),score=16.48 TRINITY_DN11874_c0_g1_i1:186-662(+)
MRRTLRVSSYGLLINGPGLAVWMRWYDRAFPVPAHRVSLVVLKALVHQLTVGASMNFSFFGWITLWQSFQGAHLSMQKDELAIRTVEWRRLWAEKLSREFADVTKNSVVAFTPFNTLNFMYVPVHWRTVTLSTGNVCWVAFLSFVGHRKSGGSDSLHS